MKLSILSAACVAFALACGGGASVPLETTPRAPAAVGVIDVTQGPNNNTIGMLHVKHLAPPAELRGDLAVYVAWVRPVGASEWQNSYSASSRRRADSVSSLITIGAPSVVASASRRQSNSWRVSRRPAGPTHDARTRTPSPFLADSLQCADRAFLRPDAIHRAAREPGAS